MRSANRISARRRPRAAARAAAAASSIAGAVVAHAARAAGIPAARPQTSNLLFAWTPDPFVVVSLALALAWYAQGVWESSGPRGVIGGGPLARAKRHAAGRRAPRRRGGRPARLGATTLFLGGWLAVALALASPLLQWPQAPFSSRLAQHAALMLVAAPLLVASRPGRELSRGLPRLASTALSALAGHPGWGALHAVKRPLPAWTIHAVLLWSWHLPGPFDAALRSEWLHGLQVLSLLGSSVLLWWTVLRDPERTRGALSLLTSALHHGLLGAWIATSSRPWHSGDLLLNAARSLDDQRRGGMILAIAAGSVFAVGALALLATGPQATNRGSRDETGGRLVRAFPALPAIEAK